MAGVVRALRAGWAVLVDLVRLTVVRPVVEGRPRTAGWPTGLRAIVVASLAVYAALTLTVVVAGPLRRWDDLVVTGTGATVPEVGVVLCSGASVLALALFQAAAMHLPWWVRILSVLLTGSVVVIFVLQASLNPLNLVPAALGLLVIVVLVAVRWRSDFAWGEFVVVAAALGTALFVPTQLAANASMVPIDWRGTSLEGALQTLSQLALPALLVAGAALAQIAVTASFSAVAAGTRELGGGTLRVLAVVLVGVATWSLVRALVDHENSVQGWVASLSQLLVLALLLVPILWVAGRPPAWSDLDEDSTRLNYLVAVCTTGYLLVSPVLTLLREVVRLTGPGWLFALLDGYTVVTRQDWMPSAMRAGVGIIGVLLALPAARRGRPWTAMFLAALAVLASFDLLRQTPLRDWIADTVPQFAGMLTVALLLAGGWLAVTGRLSTQRATALACGLLLCLVFPHRAILDDPISAALGFSGIGAVLFGLVWRLLTEGDITREGSPSWPVPARVLLYCANALLAVASTAYVALTRQSGTVLDITLYTEAGDWLLGTPLFLTATLGCLAIAVVPRRPAPVPMDQPAGFVTR